MPSSPFVRSFTLAAALSISFQRIIRTSAVGIFLFIRPEMILTIAAFVAVAVSGVCVCVAIAHLYEIYVGDINTRPMHG